LGWLIAMVIGHIQQNLSAFRFAAYGISCWRILNWASKFAHPALGWKLYPRTDRQIGSMATSQTIGTNPDLWCFPLKALANDLHDGRPDEAAEPARVQRAYTRLRD